MDQDEEKALARRLVRMDEGAWELFCKEYSSLLLRFVQLEFGCSREVGEEIVQMAFVRCVKSIGSFKPSRGRLLPWLKAICRNEAHTILRRGQARMIKKPLSLQSRDVPYEMLSKIDSAILPDAVLSRREVKLMIHEAMLELSNRHRRVLTLKYVEGRKVSEIAAILGQSEKAIESLLSRSRKAFQKMLAKKLKDSEMEEGELLK